MSNAAGKDTIYIDVDDEITTIIDKVRSSDQRIVALVLPKRAAVLQSIVNMKLLKRTADEAKKHMVLITAEAGLLPLAGSVGIYVAKTLQSKPEIPTVPGAMRHADDDEELEEPLASDASPDRTLDKTRAVGDYTAAGVGSGPFTSAAPEEETIELDDDAENEMLTPSEAAAGAKAKKERRLKIPDFNKFRVLIIAGASVLVLLIIAGYFAVVRMPKANIVIKTDSSAISSNVTVVLKTDATKTIVDEGIVPATLQESIKTQTQQVDATGQLNKGQKATGQITVTNCSSTSITLAAGTGFSANGLTFVSQAAATVPKSTYSFGPGGFTCNNDGKATINVAAQKGGANYNAAATSYTIANSPENTKAQGTAMAGGTDEMVKVVSQSDIDGANQKLTEQDTTVVKQELQKALMDKKLFAVPETFAAGEAASTASAKVGDEVTSVTVTQKITYTMFGAKESELKNLIANEVNKKIDPKKQKILDDGIESAIFNVESQAAKSVTVSMQTTSVAGSALDLEALKKQVAGKKASQAKEILQANPGVTSVNVEYSPFWVSSIPKNTGKITLVVEKPQVKNAKDN